MRRAFRADSLGIICTIKAEGDNFNCRLWRHADGSLSLVDGRSRGKCCAEKFLFQPICPHEKIQNSYMKNFRFLLAVPAVFLFAVTVRAQVEYVDPSMGGQG